MIIRATPGQKLLKGCVSVSWTLDRSVITRQRAFKAVIPVQWAKQMKVKEKQQERHILSDYTHTENP